MSRKAETIYAAVAATARRPKEAKSYSVIFPKINAFTAANDLKNRKVELAHILA